MIGIIDFAFYWTGAVVWFFISALLVLLLWNYMGKLGVIIFIKNLFYLPAFVCISKKEARRIYDATKFYWDRNNRSFMSRMYYKVLCWKLDIVK